ncbi:MAG: uracil-DNA glycosylase family protein [Proteobacteria bacterium]|nr:uracil-DNA glycosylase family protein [Pseudomonadota bacterium]
MPIAPDEKPLANLLDEIGRCRLCAPHLPHEPRPVVQAGRNARLRIVGQAPGRKVHQSGIPWDDASGNRLRAWIGLTPAEFYDAEKVAIIPMGLCYPGKAASGDNPPRPECAPRWHARLAALLPDIGLTLLIGQYALASYLGAVRKATLGDTVRAWREYLPRGVLPLPHPSPRNQPWLARNPWFEGEMLPDLQAAVRAALTDRSTHPLS